MTMLKTDTKATDREVLNATKGLTEALYRHGHLTEEEVRASEALRRTVGAKPLNLGDVRGFNASTLTPGLAPESIRALREREGASQAVLARYLGVATATLSQWERGVRRPEGPALRLLGLAERHGLDYIR